jgi:hypothetical protein
MQRKRTHDSLGRLLVETDFIEGRGWCADLVRAQNGKLVLVKYQNDSYDQPAEGANTLECESYVACAPEEDEVTRHIYFAAENECYGIPPSEDVLLERIERFLSCCLDLDSNYLFLLACFVISTWLADWLPVAPYIALVGLPGSGKSTALHALYLICRRGMVTTDISSAAFYQACDRLRPTLCIDEAAGTGQKRMLFHLLRSGTTRHALAFRQGQSYRAYGPKVVAWTEMPDDSALNSRCIIIPMQETSQDLLRPMDPVIQRRADLLRANLHMYRIKNYRMLGLRTIPGVERLRSRDRDLYEALAFSIWNSSKACERLLDSFTNQADREPLSPYQIAVLEGLFQQIHAYPDEGAFALRQLRKAVDNGLKESGEHFRLTEKAISGVLSTLGFLHRKRTNAGWVVLIDRHSRTRIHDLLSLYCIDSPAKSLSSQKLAECEICRAQKLEMPIKLEHSDHKDLYRRIREGEDWANKSAAGLDEKYLERQSVFPRPSAEDLLGPDWRNSNGPAPPQPNSENGEHSERSERSEAKSGSDDSNVRNREQSAPSSSGSSDSRLRRVQSTPIEIPEDED